MRPASLDELGAGPALKTLIERVRRLSGLSVSADIELAYEGGRASERHVPEIEVAMYRLVQEGLNNAWKHGGGAEVDVSVVERDQTVVIRVHDNGLGFVPDAHHEGFGLIGVRERVALAGGTLSVQASPGAGTTLEASLPARRRAPAAARQIDIAS